MKKNLFEMGATLNGDIFDTKKEDKNQKVEEIIPKKQHELVFKYEKRRGKPVTLIGRFYLQDNQKKEILSFLKKKLACGGSISEEWLEFQGDLKDKIRDILEKEGWKFRRKQ